MLAAHAAFHVPLLPSRQLWSGRYTPPTAHQWRPLRFSALPPSPQRAGFMGTVCSSIENDFMPMTALLALQEICPFFSGWQWLPRQACQQVSPPRCRGVRGVPVSWKLLENHIHTATVHAHQGEVRPLRLFEPALKDIIANLSMVGFLGVTPQFRRLREGPVAPVTVHPPIAMPLG